MNRTGTSIRPRLFERLKAAVLNIPLRPVDMQSTRMPDLEVWKAPHRAVDMRDWEVAYNMANNAERPDRTRLLDLYDSLLVDSHLASNMESRVLRVVRSKFRLVNAKGDAVPELLRLFEHQWFEDFLRYTAESKFRGHTLIELSELAGPGQLTDVNRIDPRNVLPWSGVVVKRRGEETGYKFREAPLKDYLIEVGRADDLGLLSQVAPVAVVKKYAIGSWSDYVEKFGIPARWVKSSSTDKMRVRQLEEVMQNMVSAAYAVIHGDEEIQVMPTPGTDAHKVFDELISRMNSEISKRILGQDGTSDNKDASGTYGSLKVLQTVAEDRHQADKSAALYVINNELLPRLVLLGYPLKGIRFEWDSMRDLSASEVVDAVAKLGMVYDIDPKYVEERTGMRILGARRMPGELGGDGTGSGRQGGADPEPDDDDPDDDDPDDDDPDDDPEPPKDRKKPKAFRSKRPIGFRTSRPTTALSCCPGCGGARVMAAAPSITTDAIDALLGAAFKGEDWSQPYFAEVGQHYRDGLLSTWNTSLQSLDYNAVDHGAAAAMELNVFRFSAAKTTAALLDLNREVKNSKGFADFKRRAHESGLLDDYNKHKLAVEYQLAVNTGMQSSRYWQQVRDRDAFPYLEYYTQGDDQVRPAHAALDGKVFKSDDPVWDKIYPPNGWNCRCTVLPVAFKPEEVLTEQQGLALMASDPKGYEAMQKGGFLVNRAKVKEVFDLNKAYTDELRGKDPKAFTFNLEQSYGEDMSHATLKAAGLPARGQGLADQQAAMDWFEANAMHTDSDGIQVLVTKDSAGRPITLGPHTLRMKGGDGGFAVANRIPDVLKAPDELWITSIHDRPVMSYVKLYDEGTMRVAVGIDDKELFVHSFTGNLSDAQRSGLLIKPLR